MTTRPDHEIRHGFIVVRVWRKKARGKRRFSVSVARLFRNGEEWKESTRFHRKDIPVVRLALDEAYVWIHENQRHIEEVAK